MLRHDSLNELGTCNSVELYWLHGYRDIPDNEEADKLAKIGASLDTDTFESFFNAKNLRLVFNFSLMKDTYT